MTYSTCHLGFMYMFFFRCFFVHPWNRGRFQCHNFQMGRKKMNVLLLHSFAPEAFLQVPLPANLPRLLDDGERARKAGKAAKSLDLFLDCSKTQQIFMRQIMADIKRTTCKQITHILIYIYIYFFHIFSKKACTSSAVFRYPINRNPCHWRPEFCTRQAEARAELKDFCPVTLVETGKLVKAWWGFTLQEVLYHCVQKKQRSKWTCSKTQTISKDVDCRGMSDTVSVLIPGWFGSSKASAFHLVEYNQNLFRFASREVHDRMTGWLDWPWNVSKTGWDVNWLPIEVYKICL